MTKTKKDLEINSKFDCRKLKKLNLETIYEDPKNNKIFATQRLKRYCNFSLWFNPLKSKIKSRKKKSGILKKKGVKVPKVNKFIPEDEVEQALKNLFSSCSNNLEKCFDNKIEETVLIGSESEMKTFDQKACNSVDSNYLADSFEIFVDVEENIDNCSDYVNDNFEMLQSTDVKTITTTSKGLNALVASTSKSNSPNKESSNIYFSSKIYKNQSQHKVKTAMNELFIDSTLNNNKEQKKPSKSNPSKRRASDLVKLNSKNVLPENNSCKNNEERETTENHFEVLPSNKKLKIGNEETLKCSYNNAKVSLSISSPILISISPDRSNLNSVHNFTCSSRESEESKSSAQIFTGNTKTRSSFTRSESCKSSTSSTEKIVEKNDIFKPYPDSSTSSETTEMFKTTCALTKNNIPLNIEKLSKNYNSSDAHLLSKLQFNIENSSPEIIRNSEKNESLNRESSEFSLGFKTSCSSNENSAKICSDLMQETIDITTCGVPVQPDKLSIFTDKRESCNIQNSSVQNSTNSVVSQKAHEKSSKNSKNSNTSKNQALPMTRSRRKTMLSNNIEVELKNLKIDTEENNLKTVAEEKKFKIFQQEKSSNFSTSKKNLKVRKKSTEQPVEKMQNKISPTLDGEKSNNTNNIPNSSKNKSIPMTRLRRRTMLSNAIAESCIENESRFSHDSIKTAKNSFCSKEVDNTNVTEAVETDCKESAINSVTVNSTYNDSRLRRRTMLSNAKNCIENKLHSSHDTIKTAKNSFCFKEVDNTSVTAEAVETDCKESAINSVNSTYNDSRLRSRTMLSNAKNCIENKSHFSYDTIKTAKNSCCKVDSDNTVALGAKTDCKENVTKSVNSTSDNSHSKRKIMLFNAKNWAESELRSSQGTIKTAKNSCYSKEFDNTYVTCKPVSKEVDNIYVTKTASKEVHNTYIAKAASKRVDNTYITKADSKEVDNTYVAKAASKEVDNTNVTEAAETDCKESVTKSVSDNADTVHKSKESASSIENKETTSRSKTFNTESNKKVKRNITTRSSHRDFDSGFPNDVQALGSLRSINENKNLEKENKISENTINIPGNSNILETENKSSGNAKKSSKNSENEDASSHQCEKIKSSAESVFKISVNNSENKIPNKNSTEIKINLVNANNREVENERLSLKPSLYKRRKTDVFKNFSTDVRSENMCLRPRTRRTTTFKISENSKSSIVESKEVSLKHSSVKGRRTTIPRNCENKNIIEIETIRKKSNLSKSCINKNTIEVEHIDADLKAITSKTKDIQVCNAKSKNNNKSVLYSALLDTVYTERSDTNKTRYYDSEIENENESKSSQDSNMTNENKLFENILELGNEYVNTHINTRRRRRSFNYNATHEQENATHEQEKATHEQENADTQNSVCSQLQSLKIEENNLKSSTEEKNFKIFPEENQLKMATEENKLKIAKEEKLKIAIEEKNFKISPEEKSSNFSSIERKVKLGKKSKEQSVEKMQYEALPTLFGELDENLDKNLEKLEENKRLGEKNKKIDRTQKNLDEHTDELGQNYKLLKLKNFDYHKFKNTALETINESPKGRQKSINVTKLKRRIDFNHWDAPLKLKLSTREKKTRIMQKRGVFIPSGVIFTDEDVDKRFKIVINKKKSLGSKRKSDVKVSQTPEKSSRGDFSQKTANLSNNCKNPKDNFPQDASIENLKLKNSQKASKKNSNDKFSQEISTEKSRLKLSQKAIKENSKGKVSQKTASKNYRSKVSHEDFKENLKVKIYQDNSDCIYDSIKSKEFPNISLNKSEEVISNKPEEIIFKNSEEIIPNKPEEMVLRKLEEMVLNMPEKSRDKGSDSKKKRRKTII